MTSATAIQAAEPIGPGTRYRWQVGREMYEAGRGAAEAEMAGGLAPARRARGLWAHARRTARTALGTGWPRPLRRTAPGRVPGPVSPGRRKRTRTGGKADEILEIPRTGASP